MLAGNTRRIGIPVRAGSRAAFVIEGTPRDSYERNGFTIL